MSDDDRRLVEAALARDDAAVRAVDQIVKQAAAAAAKRLSVGAMVADEIAQRVAEKLWIGRGSSAPVLPTYTGEVPLSAWLRVVAYREGVDLLRTRDAPGDDDLVERIVGGTEPELAMLKRSYLAAFRAAFRDALAGLSLHDRDLLRRHYLDGLGLAGLATLHGVHRATAARWLAQVRDKVLVATRAALTRSLAGEVELAEVLAMISSQLEVTLSRELAG